MTTNPESIPTRRGGPMPVEEYLQLDWNASDAKYEYVDGVARLMSGGSAEHDRITFNARAAIQQHFMSGPCTVFGSDMQVLAGTKANGQENYFYPDMTISCDVADRRRGVKRVRSPRVVVEVLSPGTEAMDRGKKLAMYKACPSIHEIVLINQFAQYVEIYRRDEEDEATWRHAFYEKGSEVELKSVDVHFSIEELYIGINFDEPLIGE